MTIAATNVSLCFLLGAGLMEIITDPDFSCGQDAAMFVKDLQRLLVVIGACDGKMAGVWV
jgi:Asp-tRNA(Asn)/Glu-tRNA(Gln) amidotransferase B subunit